MRARLPHLIVAIGLCLGASGCGGGGDSAKVVTVRGTAQGADGQPVGGAVVVLMKEADAEAVPSGLGATGCLAASPPPRCTPAERATTAADGTYTFTLRSAKGVTYELATGTVEGPSVSTRFQVAGGAPRLPSLRLWSPKVELTVTANRTARANWPSRGVGASDQVVYAHAGQTTWIAGGTPPVAIDTRVLEDDQGTAVVESTSTSEAGGDSFRITYRSGPAPYVGSAGPPPSRGLPCLPAPCVLTDGDLTTAASAGAPLHEVTVDLTRSTAIALIVVRGCPAACDVDTSVDGLTYKLVNSGDQPFQFVTPPRGPDVRYVRVKSVADLSRLTEVSVW